MKIEITGLDKFQKDMVKFSKQIDYATMNTLNDLAFDIRDSMTAEVKGKFGGPLPMNKASVFHVEKATKKNLVAKVEMNNGTYNKNGINYVEKIGHHFTGGKRSHKRGEGRLFYGKYMNFGEIYTYGEEAPLTKGGYITGGTINKMFASARVKGRNIGVTNTEQYHKRGRPKKGTKAKGYGKKGFFVVGNNSSSKTRHLKRGIYKRDKADLLPMLIFTRDGFYKPIFDLSKVSEKVIKRRANKYLYKNMDKAMKTAK